MQSYLPLIMVVMMALHGCHGHPDPQLLDAVNKYCTKMIVSGMQSVQPYGGACPSWTPRVKDKDCADVKARQPGASDGVYTIQPAGSQVPFKVYCDMTTSGGGWTVIQRRMDGSENFYRSWHAYKLGFGNLTREFWLGNIKIHSLTEQRLYEIRFDLTDQHNSKVHEIYRDFGIEGEAQSFRLSVGSYSGTAGDSFAVQNGQRFSAKDRDLDAGPTRHCANIFMGGWWYKDCHDSNLNGDYNNNYPGKGLNWRSWRGDTNSLIKTEMKIRPQ